MAPFEGLTPPTPLLPPDTSAYQTLCSASARVLVTRGQLGVWLDTEGQSVRGCVVRGEGVGGASCLRDQLHHT